MKTFKEFLASKGITDAQFEAMELAEVAKLHNEYNEAVRKEINLAIQGMVSKDEYDSLKTKLDALEEANKGYEALEKAVKEQGDALTKLREQEQENFVKDFSRELAKDLRANAEKLKELKSNPNGSLSLELKAVASMTFATHVTGRVGRQEREAGIVRDLLRKPKLMDLFNVSSTNAQTYTWVEKTGREGGVTMVAEGATKPQGDFDLIEYTQTPKKDALIITVSKEMLDDIDGLQREIEDEVREQITLFSEDATLTGDGTGNNIEGMDANATAYAAGVFAGTVDSANIFDVIRTAVNQVELNNDFPTAVLMHPSDATKMDLIKDPTTGIYIMPPFVSAGGQTVAGLPIVTSTVVTQDELYVGNFNRFKVKIREDITLQVGYRGAAGDWEKNMISFLGEQRLFAFIPANHYGSIVKADVSVATAALETP